MARSKVIVAEWRLWLKLKAMMLQKAQAITAILIRLPTYVTSKILVSSTSMSTSKCCNASVYPIKNLMRPSWKK